MDLVGIDRRAVEKVGRALKKHSINLPRLDLYDQRYYPPATADEESVARYFVVMVSMDHRLSRPGRPYEACLEDGCYHGADLLYRLGKLKFDEDPSFFDPARLAEVKVEDVVKWLSVGGAAPPDPEVRAMLLRDLGFKLTRLWDGQVTKLVKSAGGRLRGTLGEQGLVDLMRVFRAFEDPVEKKTMLLAKFLAGRGLFNPVDELDVAVDNHLTRQAIRIGLVVVSGGLWDKIKRGVEISRDEDVLLRLTVRLAYRHLSSTAGIRASALDDFFWLHGRTVCLRDKPECDKCVLRNVCAAFRNKSFMVNEPTYYNTWFY